MVVEKVAGRKRTKGLTSRAGVVVGSDADQKLDEVAGAGVVAGAVVVVKVVVAITATVVRGTCAMSAAASWNAAEGVQLPGTADDDGHVACS